MQPAFKDRTIDVETCLRTDRMVLATFAQFIEDLNRQDRKYLDDLYQSEEFKNFAQWSHRIVDDAQFSAELKQLNEGKA